MSNLLGISDPYLHSTPETFYNNLMRETIPNENNNFERIQKKFEIAISEFKTRKKAAQEKERQFYTYFKNKNGNIITSAEQWAENFLINKTNEASLSQKVLNVFNSNEMAKAMSSLSKIDDKLLKQRTVALIREAGLDKRTKDKMLKKIDNASASALEKIIGDILEQAVMGGRKENSKIKDADILIPLVEKIEGTLSELITATGQGRNIGKKGKSRSQSIRQATKALSRKNSSQEDLIKKILEILKEGLKEQGVKDEKTLSLIEDKFRSFIKDKIINLSSFSYGDWSNIVGGVQEVGSVISINLIEEIQLNEQKNIKISAKSCGQEFVKRAHLPHEVESKTDTIIEFAENETNNKFRIQEKNSLNSIYNDLEVVDFLDKQIEQKFAKMKVQGETSLMSYYETATAGEYGGISFLGEDEKSLLSYVLVNFLAFSDSGYKRPEWKEEGMGQFHKGVGSSVRGLIEQLLSLNALVYFSDIIPTVENAMSIDTIDFIIYKSRFLIPMSYIYYDIIGFLQHMGKYMIGAANAKRSTQLYTSFNFNFSKYQEMYEKKREVLEKAEKNEGKNYSNLALLAVGKKYGSEALSEISIRSVQLEIDPRRFRNLIAQTFAR